MNVTPSENPDDIRMSFGEHLEDLRGRLIKAIIGLSIGTAICTIFGEELQGFLTSPYIRMMREKGYDPQMVTLDPTEIFFQFFQTSLIFGIGLSAPFALYQLWQFVAAGLYVHERRWVGIFAPASMGLFFGGVLFFIKLVLPATLAFLISTVAWVPNPKIGPLITATQPTATMPASLPLLSHTPANLRDGDGWISTEDGSLNWMVGGQILRVHGTLLENERLIKPMYGLSLYLDFVNGMCLAFGLGFQIPIIVVLLVLIGIVSTGQLRKLRKVIVLVIVAAGAVLTPSGDILSQMLLAVPMFLLFESGVFIARRIEVRRETAKSADASSL